MTRYSYYPYMCFVDKFSLLQWPPFVAYRHSCLPALFPRACNLELSRRRLAGSAQVRIFGPRVPRLCQVFCLLGGCKGVPRGPQVLGQAARRRRQQVSQLTRQLSLIIFFANYGGINIRRPKLPTVSPVGAPSLGDRRAW